MAAGEGVAIAVSCDPSDARILHLFANYKWTGPADPAIRAAADLRRLGLDVVFARAGWTLPGAEHRMDMELARAHMPVVGGLSLPKHFRPWLLLRDRRTLAERLVRGDFDILHAHQPADHLVAALALARARKVSARRPVLVRTLYDPDAPARSWRTRQAFAGTDGVLAPSSAVARAVVERFGLSAARVLVQEPTTPLTRSAPAGDLRARFGASPEHVLVGITARIQPHRRFDLLWETAAAVVKIAPQTRFVLLGRGNAADTVALVQAPLERLGLRDHVLLPGYLYEPEYTQALRSLDVFLFLVPGSDGTCRAVREAMAMGLPVVATPRGMLPQILAPVADSGAPPGIVAREEPDALAAAVLSLIEDRGRRRAMGSAARVRVEREMDPARAARRLREFYAHLLSATR